eukprot:scaffold203572_cov28-Tisochrysis_lutea.AAC.1
MVFANAANSGYATRDPVFVKWGLKDGKTCEFMQQDAKYTTDYPREIINGCPENYVCSAVTQLVSLTP